MDRRPQRTAMGRARGGALRRAVNARSERESHPYGQDILMFKERGVRSPATPRSGAPPLPCAAFAAKPRWGEQQPERGSAR
jgi:hypothetical protein